MKDVLKFEDFRSLLDNAPEAARFIIGIQPKRKRRKQTNSKAVIAKECPFLDIDILLTSGTAVDPLSAEVLNGIITC